MIKLRDYQQELYDNARNAIINGYKRPLIVAPCGAGKSYIFAKMVESASKKGEVLILVHRRELLEQHIELLNNLGIINNNIRLEMIQTEVNHLREEKPSFIIIDEAHLSLSKSWEKVIKYYDTYCCGFTATPIRLDNKPLGNIFDIIIKNVTPKQLIAKNRLSGYEYYAPTLVDVNNLKKVRGDYSITDIEPLMIDKKIYSDIIDSYNRIAKGKKSIAYCVSIKHSQEIAKLFNDNGISAVHLDSNTPKNERKQIMEDFRNGKYKILCNCMLIVEGISIDDCECCLLLRPTDSLALYIQSAMRCMRYKDGKTAVIIDFVGNYTRHGLPDDFREWELFPKDYKNIRFNENGEFNIRECPNCYKVFKTANKCPYCGYEYEVKGKELEQIKEIELKKIESEEIIKEENEKKIKKREVGMCRTRAELEKIARERGYKQGWVWQQMKLRGIRG